MKSYQKPELEKILLETAESITDGDTNIGDASNLVPPPVDE